MKYLCMILFVTATAVTLAWSQSSDEARAYARSRIFTADSSLIEVDQVIISRDSVEYYIKGSQTPFVMPTSEIKTIESFKGTRGGTGSLIGSLLGAGAGVAIAVGTKETERKGIFEVTTFQTWPIYVGALVGGLIGYAIGNSVQAWDLVYTRGGRPRGSLLDLPDSRLPGQLLTYRWTF